MSTIYTPALYRREYSLYCKPHGRYTGGRTKFCCVHKVNDFLEPKYFIKDNVAYYVGFSTVRPKHNNYIRVTPIKTSWGSIHLEVDDFPHVAWWGFDYFVTKNLVFDTKYYVWLEYEEE